MTRTISDIKKDILELEEKGKYLKSFKMLHDILLQELDEYLCVQRYEEQEQEYDDFINEEELITRKG